MTVLVVGASGATGRLLVKELLGRGEQVRVVLRSTARFSDDLRNHPSLSIVQANLLELSDEQMMQLVQGCSAVASCLGHNLTIHGIWGAPYRLVTDAVRRLCEAIHAARTDKSVRFVLMNTTGNRNRDLNEPATPGE